MVFFVHFEDAKMSTTVQIDILPALLVTSGRYVLHAGPQHGILGVLEFWVLI